MSLDSRDGRQRISILALVFEAQLCVTAYLMFRPMIPICEESARLRRRPLHEGRLSDAVGKDFYVEVTLAGTVEFGEEDALPAAQGEFAVFDEDELRYADKHGLHV